MIDLFYLCRWTTHLHVSSHIIRCAHGADLRAEILPICRRKDYSDRLKPT